MVEGVLVSRMKLPLWEQRVGELRTRFQSREQWWHIDWIERLDLWRAMEESFGVWETGRRCGVLEVRQVIPVLEAWERNETVVSSMRDLGYNQDSVRSHLVDAAQVFLYDREAASLEHECIRSRRLEDIFYDEKLPCPPEAFSILAVLAASLGLVAFGGDWCDEVGDAGLDEVWQEVAREEFCDHKDNCDADLRDCHYWVWLARAGRIRPEDRYEDFRKEFWSQWLDDVVHVCTEPLDVLVDEVRRALL
jgi:hypothetical protein